MAMSNGQKALIVFCAVVFLGGGGIYLIVASQMKLPPFSCTPNCPEDTCDDDGCGNTCTCSEGTTCKNKKCVDDDDKKKDKKDKKDKEDCTPKCPEDTCDDDGCGNTCTCSKGTTCNKKKKCVEDDDDDKKDDEKKKEVYYYDNGGTNETRYKLTYDDAAKIAKEQGAKIATPAQLKEAQKAGADSCWIGWASNKQQYIPSNSNWDEGNDTKSSGCPGPKLYGSITKDFKKAQTAGVYLYGIRPKETDTSISNCTQSGVTTKCVVPWSKTKWSQSSA